MRKPKKPKNEDARWEVLMEMVVVGKLMLEPSVLYVVLNSCEYCYQCLLWQYGNHGGCTVVCTAAKGNN